jgi:FAD/FMN-containing dehydrogenase
LGLVQFQTFLPTAAASEGIHQLISISQAHGLPTYLGVLKRHRPDDFLLTHALDGFSMAMDFRVTRRNRSRVAALLDELERCALDYGGRFYFAKDSSLKPATARAFLGGSTLRELEGLKARCDPTGILSTNLSRRVFPKLGQADSPTSNSVRHQGVAAKTTG